MSQKHKIGIGTWKLQGEKAISTIKDAFKIGYTHIDTAWIYHNEKEIKQAISEFGIERDKFTITSKVRFDYEPNYGRHQFSKPDFFYSLREERFLQHLATLGLDYLDEMLIHRPSWKENDLQILNLLVSYQQKGLIKEIGVANFPLWYLKELWEDLPCPLSTNQIELHPYLFDEEMLKFTRKKKLILTAYSPLGHGNLLKQKELITISNQLGITSSQLCIAYLLTKGVKVICKTSSFTRLQVNFNAQNITLPEEIITKIDQLPKHYRYCNPPFAPKRDH